MPVAGIDVGSRRDRTAFVGLSGRRAGPLALVPVNMPLARQAALLAPLAGDCEAIAVDATGLGLGLAEALEEMGLPVLFVMIVAGDQVIHRGNVCLAGKIWLVQRLAVAIGSHALDVPGSDLGRELVRQLGNMVARITPRGVVKMEAPGVAADDLALAVALALLAQDAISPHVRIKGTSRPSSGRNGDGSHRNTR